MKCHEKKLHYLFVFGVLTTTIFMLGCLSPVLKHRVDINKNIFKKTYGSMFDAALQAGVKVGYTPTFQDRKAGVITLEKKWVSDLIYITGSTSERPQRVYTISVMLDSAINGPGFSVTGKAMPAGDVPSSFENEILDVRNAVMRASGVAEPSCSKKEESGSINLSCP